MGYDWMGLEVPTSVYGRLSRLEQKRYLSFVIFRSGLEASYLSVLGYISTKGGVDLHGG